MIRKKRNLRILDFDVETFSAGFADPNWVPQRISCIAWSWIGKSLVRYETRRSGAKEMIGYFLEDYEQADMVTGHNLLRFDLPVLNADMIRLGMGKLSEKLVQDTMKLPKTRGLKKGQGNLSTMLGVRAKKRDMDWADWDAAYEWDAVIAGDVFVDWSKVIERCVTDVKQHKQLRKRLLEEGLLKPPVFWKP